MISWVRAGDWAESPDNFQPGDADEWLESEEKAGPHGYWLVVDGDSMMPLFPQGSRILVQPEGFDLISGKFYVAIYYEPGKNRDTTVKQYVRDVGFEYLKPLNPTYRTLEVGENVRIVGRVIDYKLPPGVL
ncbi:putative HTH-type transcriptional regulator [compost metagenome]